MKDYLKYCSNLDEDEYNSLWEDYDTESTWTDKLYDLWFNIQWEVYNYLLNFRWIVKKIKKKWKS